MTCVQARISTVFIVALALSACGYPTRNQPLTDPVHPVKGYRGGQILEGPLPKTLVVLTISGGGTRAAALSLGVLEQLAATEITWEGRRCRLLDEVDVISSVSGGSITAANYGLFGDRIFEDYAAKLYRNNQSLLIRSVFSLPTAEEPTESSTRRSPSAGTRTTRR